MNKKLIAVYALLLVSGLFQIASGLNKTYEDGSGTIAGIDYCIPGADCSINSYVGIMEWNVNSEYECQMLLAETSDFQPEDIIEACQP